MVIAIKHERGTNVTFSHRFHKLTLLEVKEDEQERRREGTQKPPVIYDQLVSYLPNTTSTQRVTATESMQEEDKDYSFACPHPRGN